MNLLSSLAFALLHALWQGAAIAGLAWFATRVLLQRRSASTRFAVMHAAIWSTLVAFLWTWSALGSAAQSIATGAAVPSAAPSMLPWWVLGAWATGATWHAARLVGGLVGVARWRRDALALDGPWHGALTSLRRTMGVARPVAIGALARLDAPIVFGVLRPMILVPAAWAAGVPTAAMRAALAHELAHVVRHDYGIGLALHAIAALFHFHPGVRWMLRELDVLRELACDELAITRAIDPVEFAQALAELEGLRVLDAPVLAANGAPLVQRIQHLVTHPTTARPVVRAPLVTAIVALAIATVPPLFAFACQVEGEPARPREVVITGTEVDGGTDTDAPALAVPWLRGRLDDHAAAIDAAARRHGVDPSLLAIVTWVESRGHADARSTMGARGLMQLMPETAAGIALERGLVDHRIERLDDAAYNLDLGAYHLAALIDTYGGGDELDADVIGLAAAAYNGGPRRVDAWLAGEALPEETARYREIVVAMWQARHDAEAPRLD
jgi:soluble lytic murein transglycosylase-like protein